ncbi:MAG: succinyl-CoA synthetase subunit alpha [Euryarchaeota archaeon]|nr:succinyl-CoA synthetase subunit alpha [Euryarchaeota archaeon]
MMDSHEFLLKHSQEWSEKYPGKCIAVVDEELAAIGHNELEVFKEAKRKYPDKEISIAYLPTDDEVVTLL